MTFPLDKFILQSEADEHSPEFLNDVRAYANKLIQQNLPVIFSLHHLCLLAHVNILTFLNLTDSDRLLHYKRFKVKKKRGGYRLIQSPDDSLKYLQKWILVNILDKVPSHTSCKGFDKTSCIKENANTHLNQEAILKIDLLRFYDSINERRIYGIFKGLGYHPNLAVSLAKICTVIPDNAFLKSFTHKETILKKATTSRREGILPQGGPASPKLSNLVAKRLDIRLFNLAKKHGLNYSRYADDLTFSGNPDELLKIKKIVKKIIAEENLFVNHGKTKLIKKGGRFFVTGLDVTNSVTKVPKRFKKNIEHHLFHCIKNGVHTHLVKSNIKRRNFKDWLFGNIAYIFSIEKELGQKYFEDFKKISWPI